MPRAWFHCIGGGVKCWVPSVLGAQCWVPRASMPVQGLGLRCVTWMRWHDRLHSSVC